MTSDQDPSGPATTVQDQASAVLADSRQPARRSTSARAAMGMSSSPSAARRRSSPSGCATSIVRCPMARRPLTVSSTWFCPPRQVSAVSM